MCSTFEADACRFDDIDSRWVEMVLNHMNAVGDEREREAQFIVRTIQSIASVVEPEGRPKQES